MPLSLHITSNKHRRTAASYLPPPLLATVQHTNATPPSTILTDIPPSQVPIPTIPNRIGMEQLSLKTLIVYLRLHMPLPLSQVSPSPRSPIFSPIPTMHPIEAASYFPLSTPSLYGSTDPISSPVQMGASLVLGPNANGSRDPITKSRTLYFLLAAKLIAVPVAT